MEVQRSAAEDFRQELLNGTLTDLQLPLEEGKREYGFNRFQPRRASSWGPDSFNRPYIKSRSQISNSSRQA